VPVAFVVIRVGLDAVGSRSVPLSIYAHLFNTDDHAGNMAALGALAAPARKPYGENVIPLHG
jgi:hypothetical protein